MSETEYRNDAALAEALAAVNTAIGAVTLIASRNDGELCCDLVGVEPQLREVRDQMRAAQRELHARIKAKK